MDIQQLRHEYLQGSLSKKELKACPFEQFTLWFEEAVTAKISEPNAMALATASPQGIPSCRMVLIKSFDISGFVFFSNIYSRKGKDITLNPQAAATFWWKELERQVRIEGPIEILPSNETALYFSKRPRMSQLGTRASRQSEKIPSREFLDNEFNRLESLYQDSEIPSPPDWAGFRLVPEHFEFWQGRANRLSDRFCYEQTRGTWTIERLSP